MGSSGRRRQDRQAALDFGERERRELRLEGRVRSGRVDLLGRRDPRVLEATSPVPVRRRYLQAVPREGGDEVRLAPQLHGRARAVSRPRHERAAGRRRRDRGGGGDDVRPRGEVDAEELGDERVGPRGLEVARDEAKRGAARRVRRDALLRPRERAREHRERARRGVRGGAGKAHEKCTRAQSSKYKKVFTEAVLPSDFGARTATRGRLRSPAPARDASRPRAPRPRRRLVRRDAARTSVRRPSRGRPRQRRPAVLTRRPPGRAQRSGGGGARGGGARGGGARGVFARPRIDERRTFRGGRGGASRGPSASALGDGRAERGGARRRRGVFSPRPRPGRRLGRGAVAATRLASARRARVPPPPPPRPIARCAARSPTAARGSRTRRVEKRRRASARERRDITHALGCSCI